MNKTRILLADDHKIMRDGLRSLLEKQDDMEVVAEADNGRKAVQLAQEKKPDLVIMDISMPELNGIEATRQIVSTLPGVKVIALSMQGDDGFRNAMLDAGALTYLLKDNVLHELPKVLHAIAATRAMPESAAAAEG